MTYTKFDDNLSHTTFGVNCKYFRFGRAGNHICGLFMSENLSNFPAFTSSTQYSDKSNKSLTGKKPQISRLYKDTFVL